jgi:acetyltransferase-like isoleucine patch superfamily enzyme
MLLVRFFRLIKTVFWSFLSVLIAGGFGKGCRVNGRSKFTPETTVGDFCHFNGIVVLGRQNLLIGDHFHSGFNLVILTDSHNYKSEVLPYDDTFIPGPVTIGDFVWCGLNVTILPGVNIGDRVIVGAGSVVTKSIPAGSIVAGNPAKIIGRR